MFRLEERNRAESVRNFIHLRPYGVPFSIDKRFKGRELGKQALDEYISVKAIHWNYGEKGSWPL